MSGRDMYAQTPPSPNTPWRPPARQEQITSLSVNNNLNMAVGQAGSARRSCAFGLAVVPDVEKTYTLVDLIDLAQRTNPETCRAWEQARAAAARLGLADSAYYPTLALVNAAGYSRVEDRGGAGPVYTVGPSTTPQLTLRWTLLDFGRRDAAAPGAQPSGGAQRAGRGGGAAAGEGGGGGVRAGRGRRRRRRTRASPLS